MSGMKPVDLNQKTQAHIDWIAVAGLIVAVVGVMVAIATPEIRCHFHLQSDACPAHNLGYQGIWHRFQTAYSSIKHNSAVSSLDVHHLFKATGRKLIDLWSSNIFRI